MECPENIKLILFKILDFGILRIRTSAEHGDSEFCRIEANHLHNLPSLLLNFSLERLKYYLDVEVSQYLYEAGGEVSSEFKNNIEALKKIREVLEGSSR